MKMQTLATGYGQSCAVQCHCRAPLVRPRTSASYARWGNQVLVNQLRFHAKGDRIGPARAGKTQPGKGSKAKPQQPEVTLETIPTDEATEAADTEPATAPAADASSPTKAGSKGSSRSKNAPKPEPKGSQGLNKETNPVQEWIADGTAELEQEGVNPKFAKVFVEDLIENVLMNVSAQDRTTEERDTALKSSKEQYLRLNADFENFRRRTAGEKLALRDSTKGDVIMKLVPLIDNFEAAKKAIKVQSDAEQKIVDSYQGLYKQMVDSFRSLGVEAVPGVGHPFDPNFHEAIVSEENDDVPDGTVLQEFRKGFKCGDRLIRAAMVKVSSSDVQPAAQPVLKDDGNSDRDVPDADIRDQATNVVE